MGTCPFLGQLGSTPAIPLPDSHNAGDFGSFLIGAPHEYAVTEEQLEHRTDGHMDVDAVRAGAILLVPVKVPGGGIYLGDMHALQGDGEIAGHTMDVAGTVTLQVDVVKGCRLDGPVLFPLVKDLPYLARPLAAEEIQRARALAKKWGSLEIEKSAPISVIGTGGTINDATENGLNRAATLLIFKNIHDLQSGWLEFFRRLMADISFRLCIQHITEVQVQLVDLGP